MNTDKLRNGLQVCVDWLAFTVTELNTVKDVVEFLGFDIMQFSQAPRGAMGYKSMCKLDGFSVSVLSEGNEDMGIHVNISGSAVAHCVAAYRDKLSAPTPFDDAPAMQVDDFSLTALSQFLKDILEIGHITRMDLALDDYGHNQYFSVSDIQRYLEEDRVVSKFRKYHTDIDYKMGGEIIGHTLYLGSRKSDVFLRIYDKKLEQNAKHPENASEIPWIRWEFELKNDRAMSVANMLISGRPLGEITVGVLANYVRLIELDNNNRSRCSTLPLWQLFIDGVRKLQLYVPEVPKTLEDKKVWIIDQVLPTLTGIIIADGGYDIIERNWDRSISRMKTDMVDLVNRSFRV